MRREFWVNPQRQGEDNFYQAYSSWQSGMHGMHGMHVREVLPGEDNIIKVLVEALEEIGSMGFEERTGASLYANEALAKYQAWKKQGDEK